MNPWPVLRDSWFFFSRNLATIVALCMPIIVVESLAQFVLASTSGSGTPPAYSDIIDLLFYPLYTAALIIFMAARSNGELPRVANVLAVAVAMWPRFAVLAALNYILLTIGISLLLIPGIYVLVKLAFSEYLLVLRGLTPLAAMRGSFTQTTGHFARILLCGLCAVTPLLVIQFFSLTAGDDLLLRFSLDCLKGLLDLFSTVVMFRLFMLISSETAPR
jgi:uncharacterized membrane protein